MAISPAEPKGITPFPSDLSLVTTVSALRGEQKRTEEVVRKALAKAQETCLALAGENAALRAEIVILRGRLETAEGIHAASLRAKDAQIAALQAREAEFEAKKADDEAKKAAVIQKIQTLSQPHYTTWAFITIRDFEVFRSHLWMILEEYLSTPLKHL